MIRLWFCCVRTAPCPLLCPSLRSLPFPSAFSAIFEGIIGKLSFLVAEHSSELASPCRMREAQVLLLPSLPFLFIQASKTLGSTGLSSNLWVFYLFDSLGQKLHDHNSFRHLLCLQLKDKYLGIFWVYERIKLHSVWGYVLPEGSGVSLFPKVM